MSKADRDRQQAAQLFMSWSMNEGETGNPKVFQMDEEFKKSLTYAGIHGKQMQFGLDVEVPYPLYLMFMVMTEDNPGKSILLFKQLLDSINQKVFLGEGIDKGYKIRSVDFSFAFPSEFPCFADEKVNMKYAALWDSQKVPRKTPINSDNACDYPEYWEGLMKK